MNPAVRAPALVVGFAIHGLAVARALARQGVEVFALSDRQSGALPTTFTRFADVRLCDGLNTPRLPGALLDFARASGVSRRIVLFPTSDRIAAEIARAWDQLQEYYALSWAHCRELVLSLQRKDTLAAYCERSGVRFPRTRGLQGAEEADAVVHQLRFPIVVKPARPLSRFKALRIGDAGQLMAVIREYDSELPFVAQEWIDADGPSLCSCTAYLDRGRAICTTTNRKLDAMPPGLGQGTVFETTDDADIVATTTHFLSQLDLSGPVAVEYKRDRSGVPWLIEPNVGRTEYCVDLAIQEGLNLPYVEYLHVTGADLSAAIDSPHRHRVWFDTDRDPTCALRHLRALVRDGRFRRPVFPYWGHADWRPLLASAKRQIVDAVRGALRRSLRIFRRQAP